MSTVLLGGLILSLSILLAVAGLIFAQYRIPWNSARERPGLHVLAVAVLAASLAFTLFTVITLDRPFGETYGSDLTRSS